MQKIIPWFPANWPFAPTRQQYFLHSGYVPLPYTPENIREAEVLLLVTPVLCSEEDWISPEWVWQNYLAEINPAIKVIQAGWDNSAAAGNYLHWNRLPDDFAGFLKSSKSVGDDWTPHWTYGDDLRQVWTRFRDGHDKSGFMDWFIVAHRRSITVSNILADDGGEYTNMLRYLNQADTREAFENLVKRWCRYEPLLMAAPCGEELKEITTRIVLIETGWQDCRDSKALALRMELFVQEFNAIEELLQRIEKWFKTTLL